MTRTIPDGLTRAGRCALVCEGVHDKMLEAVYLDGGLNEIIKFLTSSMTIASAYDFMKEMRKNLDTAVHDIHEFRKVVLESLSLVDEIIAEIDQKPKETAHAVN